MSISRAMGAVAVGCLALTACAGRGKTAREVPLPPGTTPAELRDAPAAEFDRFPNPDPAVQRHRAERDPAATLPTRPPGAGGDYLVLSGLGSRSLYTLGVVCGWADASTMPDFDVVTGVGGGAHVAAMVFAGRDDLNALRSAYLALDQSRLPHGDVWDFKRFPHPLGLGTASVATTRKLHALTTKLLTNGYFARVAAEHAKGRRLYVGTTNLDTQRFVVWDLGAIATTGTPAARALFEQVLVASTAMPPLLEPERITVVVDGRAYEEMHVDGGITRSLFWQPPADQPGDGADHRAGARPLAGGRVHVVLGGKVYNDPAGTDAALGAVALRAMKGALFALHRAELARLHTLCMDRGMTMRLAAIPPDYAPPLFQTYEFVPSQTRALFNEGYTRTQDGRAWDSRPPDRAADEDRPRRGAALTATGETCGPGPAPVR